MAPHPIRQRGPGNKAAMAMDPLGGVARIGKDHEVGGRRTEVVRMVVMGHDGVAGILESPHQGIGEGNAPCSSTSEGDGLPGSVDGDEMLLAALLPERDNYVLSISSGFNPGRDLDWSDVLE